MNKYLKLKEEFVKNKDDNKKASMEAYMQDNFMFLGLDAKRRKEIQKPFIKQEKDNKQIDWIFLKECYNDSYREMQYFVLDCLEEQAKYLVFDDITNLEYFVNNKQWWDSIDKLDKIIGSISYNDERLDDLMLKWSQSENLWKRRLAIDHQQARKEKTNSVLLEKIIVNNLKSNEFFINKAIGWSLRDYYKINPEWVKRFIIKYQDKLSKLSIKEATKYQK